jgi:hypothetical protein
LGALMRKHRKVIGQVLQSALEDEWQRQATAAAIAAARGVIRTDGAIPPATPVGRLGDVEWGWITAAILFGWIQTRARQAAAESFDTEQTVRMTALDPDPWDTGAAIAILPDLAAACSDIDWSKPLTAWSRETMAEFLITAMPLIRKAMIARDISGKGITRKSSASEIAREANASADGPLMTPDEFDDDIPM